jgi:hypothetical protein
VPGLEARRLKLERAPIWRRSRNDSRWVAWLARGARDSGGIAEERPHCIGRSGSGWVVRPPSLLLHHVSQDGGGRAMLESGDEKARIWLTWAGHSIGLSKKSRVAPQHRHQPQVRTAPFEDEHLSSAAWSHIEDRPSAWLRRNRTTNSV